MIKSWIIILIFFILFVQNSEASANCSGPTVKCKHGLIIPMWEPSDNLATGDKVGRAVIYFLALGYLFLGVSIVADRFMAAIEVITSQERKITINKANGEKFELTVHVWNE